MSEIYCTHFPSVCSENMPQPRKAIDHASPTMHDSEHREPPKKPNAWWQITRRTVWLASLLHPSYLTPSTRPATRTRARMSRELNAQVGGIWVILIHLVSCENFEENTASSCSYMQVWVNINQAPEFEPGRGVGTANLIPLSITRFMLEFNQYKHANLIDQTCGQHRDLQAQCPIKPLMVQNLNLE